MRLVGKIHNKLFEDRNWAAVKVKNRIASVSGAVNGTATCESCIWRLGGHGGGLHGTVLCACACGSLG